MKPQTRSWRHWFPSLRRRLTAPHRRGASCLSYRPNLERLEDRLAPAGNDTLLTAIPLTPAGNQPARAAGTLVDANQVDLYQVSLQAQQILNADVTDGSPGNPKSDLSLFDGTGQQVDIQLNSGGLDTTLSFGALGTGVYYLGVSSSGNDFYNPTVSGGGAGGSATGSYTLSVTVTTVQPHDTPATAVPVAPDALNSTPQVQATGFLTDYNQVDLYRVPLQAQEVFEADAAVRLQGATLGNPPASDLRLFDSNGQPVAFQANAGTLDTTLSFTAGSAGDYYLGVSSQGQDSYDPNAPSSLSGRPGAGVYTLTLKTLHDTRATAISLALDGNQPTGAAGDLLYANEVDLYSVQLRAGEVLQATVVDQGQSGPDGVLKFFDSAGREVAPQPDSGIPDTTLSFGAVSDGEYFVGVASSNNSYDPNTSGSGIGGLAPGSYKLALTLAAFPLDDTLTTAIPLTFGGNQQAQAVGALVYFNQVDLYSVQLQAGEVLQADVTDQAQGNPAGSLRIFDSTGKEVASAVNSGSLDTTLSFGAGSAGEYFVGVASDGNSSYDPNTAGSGGGGMATGSYTLSLTLATSALDDTLATANPLALSGSQPVQTTGTLAYSNQVDLYAVPLQAGVTIKVDVAGISGQLRVFESSGHQVASRSGSTLIFSVTSTGTYYVGVSSGKNLSYDSNVSNSGSEGGAPALYSLTLAIYQPHDTLATAIPLAVNGNQQAQAAGNLTFADQVDMYAVQSQGDEILVVTGTNGGRRAFPGTQSRYPLAQWRVFDGIGREITPEATLATGPANSYFLTYVLRAAGTYYVGVASEGNDSYDPNRTGSGGNGAGTGPYTLSLTLTDPFQLHDTPATAFPLTFDSIQQVHVAGTLTFASQVDLYAVSLQAGDRVVSDFSFRVFDGAGQELTVQTSTYPTGPFSTGTQATFNAPASGVYYLGVGGSPGSYSHPLAVLTSSLGQVISETSADGLPINLSFDSAQAVPDSAMLRGTYASGATEYYRFTTPLAGSLNVAVTPVDGAAFLPSLALYSGTGQLLIQANAAGPGNASAQLSQKLQTGTYYLVVSAVVDNPSGDLGYFLNTTYQLSKPSAPSPAAPPLAALTTGVFTHDGNLDLIAASLDAGQGFTGTVSVYLGNGDGTFKTAVTYPVGAPPDYQHPFPPPYNNGISVAAGDFNGDGNLDLVVTITADDNVWLLLGRGDGTFLPAKPITHDFYQDVYVVSVAVGHFTHDGHLDIVLAQQDAYYFPTNDPSVLPTIYGGTGGVTLLLGNGDGTFRRGYSAGTGTYIDAVTVGDFNHDGNQDVAVSPAFWGDKSKEAVLFGNGDGTFQAAVTDPGVTAGLPVGVGFLYGGAPAMGDFNNDGIPDVATDHIGDTTPLVLLDKGNGQSSSVSPDSGIASRNIPFLQDLTGDGIPDELILNSSGALLFRQGLAKSSDAFAPPVIVNPDNPARDATVFRTGPHSWAVAAIDDKGNVVSLYIWDPQLNQGHGAFRRSVGFATGNYPVRIAAADLTGNGLDDLVVGNDFDNSVTIALQTSPRQFTRVLTQPIGVGPSGIAFVTEPGQSRPDVVVSDQVSGDFTVLLNDGTAASLPTFSRENRYRAGSGQFDISIDPITGEETIVSQLQTVGIVAGDFTGPGSNDLVMLNRGANSFALVPNMGQGRFGNPQSSTASLPSGDQPSQIEHLILYPRLGPSAPLPDVAVLIPALNQIWIYRDSGGTLSSIPEAEIDAGNAPTGFSVVTIDGQPALLVGNAYGDILTLLYDGHGGFAPDRASLQNAPLAVGTIAGTAQQFAVVADQGRDQVSLYYRIPGTDQFSRPITMDGTNQFPLLAPGAVQTFFVPGDTNPYLAVANSLSNNVLLYHYDSGTGQFGFLHSYQVGDEPVSITVADVNGDGVPDLLVANQGSNDVSVLIGNANAGPWSATAYQRLTSGGSGPIAVAVQNSGGANGPSLLVTNSDGTVSLLPGIGSGGKGSGFFQDTSPSTFTLGKPIVESLLTGTGQLAVVGADGSLSILLGGGFQSLVSEGVATLGAVGTFLVAGFDDGRVGLLASDGTELAALPTGFSDQPSALEALQSGPGIDVYVTERGNAVPVIVSFSFIPIVTELPVSAAVAEGTSVPGSNYLLVAILLSGTLVETLPTATTAGGSGAEVFALFLPPVSPPGGAAEANNGRGVVEEAPVEVVEQVPGQDGPTWQRFPLGVSDALRREVQSRKVADHVEEVLDNLMEILDGLPKLFKPPHALADPTEERSTELDTTEAPSAQPDLPLSAGRGSQEEEAARGSPADASVAADEVADEDLSAGAASVPPTSGG